MDKHQRTVPAALAARVNLAAGRTALRHKHLGLWREVGWRDYAEVVAQLGLGLHVLGLAGGDRVAILAENMPRWVYADVACMAQGAVVAGIYPTSSAEQVAYVLGHAQARFLFVGDEEQLDKWLTIRAQVPHLEKVIYFKDEGLHDMDDPMVLGFEDVCRLGEARQRDQPGLFASLGKGVAPTDPAMLIYTSGTTGPPKGAMLSHGGVLAVPAATFQVNPVTQEDELLSFLPLCHIFERLFSVLGHLLFGYVVNFAESVETVPDNLREVSPTVGYGVPRIWEKFHSRVLLAMGEADWFKRAVFRWSLAMGKRRHQVIATGASASFWTRSGFVLAHLLTFRKLRKHLGMDRMRIAYSGAAPISPAVLEFYQAIGINLLEGYGLTESGGVSCLTPADGVRGGAVGRPLPGTRIELAEDGEIKIQSPTLFLGYYRDEAATRAVLVDGWLLSGDVGRFDAAGYLQIIDRKKDLIITAGGKNIAPQTIENQLKFSPYINDAVVIGDRRKYLSALIVLDEEAAVKFAGDRKIPYATYSALSAHAEIIALIEREVAAVNARNARVEHVRKFRILPKRLYQEDGDVTPTMKVKRNAVNKTWADLIESMYKA